MEIIDRKENPLLNRVEIRFEWDHSGNPTPSRDQMRDEIANREPGASKERVIVKDVDTRFGRPLTTGLAFVYDTVESLQNEPQYVRERHTDEKSEGAAKSAPAQAVAEVESEAVEEASETIPEVDVSGGEE